MSQQWIFITPQDVWMFRDSRAFTAGESFFARSTFPPLPSTAQGMIRTFHYEQTGGTVIGSSSDMGGLKLVGPFVTRQQATGLTCCFPLPLDVHVGSSVVQFAPSTEPGFESNLGTQWRPLIPSASIPPGKADEREYWIDQSNFAAYLSDKPFSITPADDLFKFEERTGLGMDHDRRAHREGQFYRAAFVRPHDGVGLLMGVDYEKPIFPPSGSGTLAVGGESRIGQFTVVQYQQPVYQHSEQVKVVLLTPAWFSGGWLPADNDWSPWLGPDAKLISAAIGKPRAASGWDMALQQPKALRHFVPAGSVYYFENAITPTKPFTESAVGEPDFAAMGYGAFATTNWKYI